MPRALRIARQATTSVCGRRLCEQYVDDDKSPVSEFTRDQGVKWYDHDFLETAVKKRAKSIENLAKDNSHQEQWAEELAKRAKEAGLPEINLLVFISRDQIRKPKSVKGDGYSLHFMGTITYQID